MTFIKALLQSFSMFTILPIPRFRWTAGADRYMLAFFPFVGMIIGGVWYLAAFLLLHMPISTIPAAAILTVTPFLLSGFLHLDGFMDVCDALLSCRDPEKRRQIRKDPHVGAFAVISFGFLLLLEFACLTSLPQKPERALLLLLLPIFSRGFSAFFLLSFPVLPDSNMGKWLRQDTGPLQQSITLGMALLALALSVLFSGIAGGIAFSAAGIIAALATWHASHSLGGISGDVTGYAVVLCEATGIIFLTLF